MEIFVTLSVVSLLLSAEGQDGHNYKISAEVRNLI
jgi:hypothetical protein